MSQFPTVKTGTFTGTGAAINISLGFIPDYVCVANITDGDATWQWWSGMDAGTAIKTTTAVATLASNGISTYAGTPTAGEGFTVGTDVSESTKVHRYVAIRGG